MNWTQLLNRNRLGREPSTSADPTRTDFQRDYDRIVFSAAFRRLQDKTQVFPLAESDYVRTRLTHSLEASCVGRSLGTQAAQRLIQRDPELATCFHPSEFGAIVAAACLAHDIGNPPFGHAGEDAISHWFRNSVAGMEVAAELDEQGAAKEFRSFEGNAQGFRILTRLEHPENAGGMQLSYATLAAFTKYPRPATDPRVAGTGKSGRKYGFFAQDVPRFRQVAEATGLLARPGTDATYARHPLAFLVEAADDICYHVVDVEDGFNSKLLGFGQSCALFEGVLAEQSGRDRAASSAQSRVQVLRAMAIGALISSVVDVFADRIETILDGSFDQALTDVIPQAEAFGQLVKVAAEYVYPAREVVLVEAAGFNVLGKLVELFLTAVNERAKHERLSPHARMLLRLFPDQFLGREACRAAECTLYDRTLAVTDFVSGLTDRGAVALFKRLTGISLPGE